MGTCEDIHSRNLQARNFHVYSGGHAVLQLFRAHLVDRELQKGTVFQWINQT